MAAQPFSGTDMAAMVLAVLAVLYAALWIRDREHGMAWLAVSFALAAVWYSASERHLPTGPRILAGQHGWAMVILRRAVERHGGRVWATAAPGRGASFCFLLPDAAG